MDDEDDLLSDYKLCGFSCVVVSVSSPKPYLIDTLSIGSRCYISGDSSDVCSFTSENGIVLSTIEANCKFTSKTVLSNQDSEQYRGVDEETPKPEVLVRENRSSRKSRMNRMGMVNGSMSVVHQIHALVMQKCLKIQARVIIVDAGVDEEVRVVLLVDVYLPIALWSGWQFPKYKTVAGALFRHLRCREWCRLPVITPCRHLLCLDCVALDSEGCTYPGCGKLYVMQTPETLARPENPNPKWPVPKDLIELQPSYKQDDWDPDWQSTSSSKVAYLIQRLKALSKANDEAACFRVGSAVIPPPSLDKSDELLQEVDHSKTNSSNHEMVREKVLIFSQFLEHIHVIEQQLTIAGIRFAGMYSPMHASNKMKSLAMFQHDASCMVLLMDGSAALGLDLSFVTHVFLMEPIWDRSMEEQVISRAHRMGATRPIQVETLVMRETIEEQMVQFLQDADECRRLLKEEFGKPDYEGPRAHRSLHDFAGSNYLSQLKFVRTNPKMEKLVDGI